MCSLSLKSGKRKRGWHDRQQAQLKKFGAPGLQPAFVGSMLCNHILVPVKSDRRNHNVEFSVPDVSSVVYGYCSDTERSSLLKDSLVIDIEENTNRDVLAPVITKYLKKSQVKRVVILGSSAHLIFQEIIRVEPDLKIESSVLEPDWMSPNALHSVYRQASSVLFINTMRVLDAACTGCRCSLIAGDKMQKLPAFNVLQSYLYSVGCEVYDESGVSIAAAEVEYISSYTLVENSRAALQKALLQEAMGENPDEDWLSALSSKESAPVITPYYSPLCKILNGFHDKRTGIRRKLAKLYDDPAAFFVDSEFKLLRLIGWFYQKKTAGG